MPQKSPPGLLDSGSLEVREVVLSASDRLQTYREKIARIILDEMYQFVGLLDPNGMVLEINRAALDGAGIELHDIYGKPVWETRWWQVSRETREKIRDLVRRAATGEFMRCDVEIYGKSGGEETIIIDFSLMPVRDRHGKIVFLLAEGRSITEKKAAHAEIARKNEELQSLLEEVRRLDQLKSDLFANVSHEPRTPLALILGPTESLITSATNLTDAQRRDLDVIRHNAATLLKHVNDLLDLAKLDAGKMTMDYVALDLVKRSRDQLQAELASKSEDLVSLTNQLILSKRTVEESLVEERKLTSLVENSHDFIGYASREGNAMFVNRAGRTLVGLDAQEVRGTVPVDYVLEEDRPLLRAGMTAALENGNWEGEVRFRNFKTGAVIPMLSHIFLLTDGNSGHEIGLGTISRDITDRKRAEEGLRAVQSELAHVSRVASMGELTASIAHEINQPLTAIVGNANACTRLMKAQSPDLEEIRLAIDDIAKSGKRASEVVSRIRAWLRKTHSERCQLDINEAILDVLPLMRGELDKHQATLHTRLQEGLPSVLGDRIELQQVLINLLLNGMEAMDEVEDRPRALVIESSHRAATVSVLIRDSGIGIGPSTITRIFDTFFTTKSNGLGMGLPICRSIIESLGGRISATAGSPHGTTFQFELPAAA